MRFKVQGDFKQNNSSFGHTLYKIALTLSPPLTIFSVIPRQEVV